MPEPRYGKTVASVGRGGPPQPGRQRQGVVAVAAKRPMEVPVARPARDLQIDELQLPGYPPAHSPQGNGLVEFAFCILCGRSDKDAAILVDGRDEDMAELGHVGHKVCDKCIERLIDRLRTELPRRRLRLAMERLASGEVTPEMLKIIEDLSSGAMVVGKKAEVGGE